MAMMNDIFYRKIGKRYKKCASFERPFIPSTGIWFVYERPGVSGCTQILALADVGKYDINIRGKLETMKDELCKTIMDDWRKGTSANDTINHMFDRLSKMESCPTLSLDKLYKVEKRSSK